jgi:hypothetical protein
MYHSFIHTLVRLARRFKFFFPQVKKLEFPSFLPSDSEFPGGIKKELEQEQEKRREIQSGMRESEEYRGISLLKRRCRNTQESSRPLKPWHPILSSPIIWPPNK